MNKLPSSTFHNHLKDLTEDAELSFAEYTDLAGYTEYINLYDAVREEELFKEMDLLKESIEESLFEDNDQRILAGLAKKTNILVDLLDAKIVNDDLEYYYSHRDGFIPQIIAHELTKLMVTYGLTQNLVPEMRVITKTLPFVERFYEVANERNYADLYRR